MPSELDELSDRAVKEAGKAGTLSDIAQAVARAKDVGETRKAIEDVASPPRSLLGRLHRCCRPHIAASRSSSLRSSGECGLAAGA